MEKTMAKILVPEVIDMADNGTGEFLPVIRTGFLARFRAPESTALRRIEQTKILKVAHVQAAGEILKAEAAMAAAQALLEYQLAKSVEVSKHKIDINATVAKYRDDLRGQRERIIAKMEADVALDMEIEGFIDGLQDLDLPPLQEVQHKMKAKATARRERAKMRRRHFHHH
jgi:hypothetical protein